MAGQSRLKHLRSDLGDADAVHTSLEDAEAVIHLAAIVPGTDYKPPTDLIKAVNYKATCALVDACQEQGVNRFVFSSTCGSYGLSQTGNFVKEGDPLNPINSYAQSKANAEGYILDHVGEHFHPTVLRLATVFGVSPSMGFKPLLNSFVKDAFQKKHVLIYGPSSWRPFVHVSDVARAMQLAIEAPVEAVAGHIFNVGANELNCQKVYLAELLKKHFPAADIELREDTLDKNNYTVCFDKVSRVLAFYTAKTIEQGVVEMKKWLQHSDEK
jgi:nucleoside-diphosphate-sugar epimerase